MTFHSCNREGLVNVDHLTSIHNRKYNVLRMSSRTQCGRKLAKAVRKKKSIQEMRTTKRNFEICDEDVTALRMRLIMYLIIYVQLAKTFFGEPYLQKY